MKRASVFFVLGLAVIGCCAVQVLHAQTQPLAEDRALVRRAAFEAVQRTQQTSAGNALTQVGARFAATRGELGDLVRQRQEQIERWTQLSRRASSKDAEVREQEQTASKAIRDLDRRLELEFPDFAELTSPKPISEAGVQNFLTADEALILIFSAARNSYVFAVSKDNADWIRVDRAENDVATSVKSLRASLDPSGATRAAQSSFDQESTKAEKARPHFPRGEAYALYRQFLGPLEPVWSGKKRLNIVVSGPLSSLPFALLVKKPPQGEDSNAISLRQTDWLIRDHALVTLPTVSSLRALRQAQQIQTAVMSFRGFGAPKLGAAGEARGRVRSGNAYFRGVYGDVEAVRQLASLPETEGELRQLAGALGADPKSVIIGNEATEAAVKRADLSKTRVLAFATHGLIAGELDGLAEPALVFTPPDKATAEDDGLLTASEAAQLKLSADWVILSACNTAADDGTPGAEGLSGLARAFFYAGAKALLVSHWPVLDIAAARLTTATFAEIQKDPAIGRAEGLRRAMLTLIDDESNPLLAEPLAWAPFVVGGDGR